LKGCLCVKILLFLVIQIAVIPGISKGDELPKFENVMSSVGISEKPMLGQTAAWNDYNSDGLLDIFITNTKIKRNARSPRKLRNPKLVDKKKKPGKKEKKYKNIGVDNLRLSQLYRNVDIKKFSDVSDETNLNDYRYRSASWGDFNNDGFPDLLVGTIMGGAPPRLFVNEKSLEFTDISKEAGLVDEGANVWHTLWVDYNNDGKLDIFSANSGQSYLYRNNGDGTFENVSKEVGFVPLNTHSAIWFDHNNDGYQDLFLANIGLNKLYKNNGDGTFRDITEEVGLEGSSEWSTKSPCVGDYDNDGFLDLYITNSGSSVRNSLYRNESGKSFSDITIETKTMDVGDGRTCAWVDFDGDGLIDIFTTNHVWDSKLYKNNGNGNFKEVAADVGLNKPVDVFGAPWGDYNNDGFIDVFLNGHLGTGLMKNGGNGNKNIIIELIGDGNKTNRSAIGTRIELRTSNYMQIREVSGGRGCCEQDMLPVHFGIGSKNKADISVTWTDGKSCSYENIDIPRNSKFEINQVGCKLKKVF